MISVVEQKKCQVLVIGAGPGGYVAAIRAGQLGLSTIIVEGEKAGGTCLIRGCIPSKAMINAAHKLHDLSAMAKEGGHMGISIPGPAELNMEGLVAWKDGIVKRLNKGVENLLKRAGAELINGWAEFIDAKTCKVSSADGDIRIEAENVILANGSVPTELPFMPFGGDVISSREALDLKEVPDDLVVVGGGYIGLELGIAFAHLGSNVSVLEAMDTVLPIFDKELRRPVELNLKRLGVKVHTGVFAKGIDDEGNVQYAAKDEQENIKTLKADKVLVTVGRRPNNNGWGLEEMGIKTSEHGFVIVDEKCATNMRGVYCIGDLAERGAMLAHNASSQGEMVAEIIAGNIREWDPVAVPAIVFTEPEIVEVGLSPEQASAEGHPVIVGKFPLAANGRALTMEAEKTGGFIRVVARDDDHRILGVQAVGSHVSELSGEFTLAIEMGALLEDVAGTIHAHPTMSEAFHEAVLATLGHAIHIT